MDRMRRLLRLTVGRRGVQRAVDDELEFHLDMRVQELERAGVPRESAARQARAEFGDLAAARRELSDIDLRRRARTARSEWLRDLVFDARLALRSYARQPGFSMVVLLTLGIGIGANTAIFSIVDSVLLRPLPFARADGLVHLWETRNGDQADLTEASYPDFLDWRAESRVFAAVEAYDPTNVTVATPEGGDMVSGARVTAGFLPMLGVPPLLGRTFEVNDDRPGGTHAVVLSHAYFQRHFGGDARVVGRSVVINGVAHEIRGVMPERFSFAPAGEIDVWLPLARSETVRAQRFNHWVNAVARLRDGVTMEAASERMRGVMTRLAAEHPETNAGRGALLRPLRDVFAEQIERPLLVLFGAVALVLLIACANVASLVLARSMERAHEMALRSAIGASRTRIVRELLAESLVLSLAGAALGAVLAVAGIRVLVAAIPPGMVDASTAARATLDVTALGFTAAVAVATGLLFGIAPAVLASRAAPADLLRSDARVGTAHSRHRVRDGLVATEIALTLVLVIGAALMGRSVLALLRLDPGYDADRVATVRVAVAGPRYEDPARQTALFEQLVTRARVVPGVLEAGAISSPPLQGGARTRSTSTANPSLPPRNGRRPRRALWPAATSRRCASQSSRAAR